MRNATTAMFFEGEDDDGVALFGKEGNTTTALGTQEWLIKAVRGEIETPMLDKSVGQVSANEFETNWKGGEGVDVSPRP